MLFCSFVSGQNLIKNPGFEEYYHLPDLIYEFGERYDDSTFICKHWHKVRATTPDYFHINAKNIRYGIPYSSRFGYHPPLTDSTYVGLHLLGLEGATEPITGEFTAPLEAGKTYEISFYYRFANSASYFYSDKIEAFISTDNWMKRIRSHLPFYKDIVKKEIAANVIFETPMINDGEWQKMTGYYHAKGGEKYISFGIFYQNEQFFKIINEYVNKGFDWGRNQHQLEGFFRKYRNDLFIHRNPYFSTSPDNLSMEVTFETNKGATTYVTKQKLCYYFIDNVSVVEVK